MIHPSCMKIGHNWSYWKNHFSNLEGKSIPVIMDTITEKPAFNYRRHCQNLGCDAIEVAEELIPTRGTLSFDSAESDQIVTKGTAISKHCTKNTFVIPLGYLSCCSYNGHGGECRLIYAGKAVDVYLPPECPCGNYHVRNP